MTFIHVMTPQGRLTADQRRVLAKTLTDAVLVPEVGKLTPEARRGYQVHFAERPLDMVEEGSWGSRGGVLSFLDLLDHGASHFSPERTAAIRTALAVKYER
jgi:hypothetical protein